MTPSPRSPRLVVALAPVAAAAALVAALTGCTLGVPPEAQATRTSTEGAPMTAPAASASTPAAAAPEAPGKEGAYLPQVGDCFDIRKDEPDLRDSLVSCDEDHDDEVYAEFELTDSTYPGEAAVLEAAKTGCVERFASFVGVPYEMSVLEVTTYQPSAEDWADGRRRVACVVWHPTSSVVGSLEGAAI